MKDTNGKILYSEDKIRVTLEGYFRGESTLTDNRMRFAYEGDEPNDWTHSIRLDLPGVKIEKLAVPHPDGLYLDGESQIVYRKTGNALFPLILDMGRPAKLSSVARIDDWNLIRLIPENNA